MKRNKMSSYFYVVFFYSFALVFNNSCTNDTDTIQVYGVRDEVIAPIEESSNDIQTNQNNENLDDENKQDNDKASIKIPCDEGGKKANESGEKIWCWENVVIPDYSNKTGVPFSDEELIIASECYEKQITQEGERLKFKVSPRNPGVESWCTRDYNMRAEISTGPWNVKNPLGTEEWYGWSYTLGDNYIIDQKNPWLFYQVHHGFGGESPQLELMIASDGLHGAKAGEVIIKATANNGEDFLTGIVPRAGQTLDVVVHVIWGDESNGLLQVWIDGRRIYDKQVRTVYRHAPWGGNSKWGVYKWPWRLTASVESSEEQGITSLEAYIGTLRGITRYPGDADYGKDSFDRVSPN